MEKRILKTGWILLLLLLLSSCRKEDLPETGSSETALSETALSETAEEIRGTRIPSTYEYTGYEWEDLFTLLESVVNTSPDFLSEDPKRYPVFALIDLRLPEDSFSSPLFIGGQYNEEKETVTGSVYVMDRGYLFDLFRFEDAKIAVCEKERALLIGEEYYNYLPHTLLRREKPGTDPKPLPLTATENEIVTSENIKKYLYRYSGEALR